MGQVRRPTLLDLRRVGEYATNFRWKIDFMFPPPVLGGSSEVFGNSVGTGWRTDLAEATGGGDASFWKKLDVLCESTNTPSKRINKIPAVLRGHQFFQPGTAEPANTSLTLNFLENSNNVVHSFFYAWQEAIWATNLGIGVPYDSLVSDRIVITRLNNADQPICNYNLRFCYLSSYSPDGLTGDNGLLRPSITLQYDDFFITGPGMPSEEAYNIYSTTF